MKIRSIRVAFATPWVELLEKEVESTPGETELYYSLKTFDYVSIVAVSSDGWVPFVRQFRSAIERETLELPSGLVDSGKSPAEMASQELWEEIGLKEDVADFRSLGSFHTDTGRLENRIHGYFVRLDHREPALHWRPEAGLSTEWIRWEDIPKRVESGSIEHAGHVALLYLAREKGWFSK